MPEIRQVPLALTEDALYLLQATYDDLASRESVKLPTGRTRPRGKLVTFNAPKFRYEACYLRLISIVESYLDVLCSELFDKAAEDQSKMFIALIAAADARADNNWEERKNAFKSYHGISLGECSSWPDIDSGIEVRNSIAHGLGRLTSRQRSMKSRQKIANAGVAVIEDDLQLTREAVRRCLDAARHFVSSVDQKVTESHPV